MIASDFINWKVVVADVSQLEKLQDLQEHELILNEVPTASFTLTESNAEDFYYWLDRFLFKEEKQRATLKRIEEEAKAPWKGLEFSGKIESQFLFRTAMAKSVLPFALYKPSLIVLPNVVDENNNKLKTIKIFSAKTLMQEGFLNASKWFQNIENIWNIHRTALNNKYTSEQYLNFQNKITTQNLNAVIWFFTTH